MNLNSFPMSADDARIAARIDRYELINTAFLVNAEKAANDSGVYDDFGRSSKRQAIDAASDIRIALDIAIARRVGRKFRIARK